MEETLRVKAIRADDMVGTAAKLEWVCIAVVREVTVLVGISSRLGTACLQRAVHV